jgi:putative membrane protein
MGYMWVKVLHVFFVIGWMAGIFYLPRIFVHFQFGKQEGANVERLKLMGQKLFSFMTFIGIFAIITGLWLLMKLGMHGKIWLHLKLTAVFFLIAYHVICGWMLSKMKKDELPFSHVFYRYFNEAPLILLFIILTLAMFKPINLDQLWAIFGK